jgi:hypothetical protein
MPVRRTVRVVMALVAGQAALCAVIGWFVFGSPHTGPKSPVSVDPQAGAPTAIPAVSLRLPAASPAPTPAAERTTASPSVRRSFRATEPPPEQPVPPEPPAVHEDRGEPTPTADDESPSTVISRVPTASPSELAPGPDPASGSPTPAATTTQDPVVLGEPCPDEGAPGVTADDFVVHCVPYDDGTLRWQVS